MKKYIIAKQPDNKNKNNNNNDDDIKALSDNKVDVDIEPDVKSNNVNLQMCSCSIVLNCFKPDAKQIRVKFSHRMICFHKYHCISLLLLYYYLVPMLVHLLLLHKACLVLPL